MKVQIVYKDIINRCEQLSSFEARGKVDASGQSRYLDIHINKVDEQLVMQYINQAAALMAENLSRMIASTGIAEPSYLDFLGIKDATEEGIEMSPEASTSEIPAVYFVRNLSVEIESTKTIDCNLIQGSILSSNLDWWDASGVVPSQVVEDGYGRIDFTSEGYLYQMVSVKPHTDYVLSFYYRGSGQSNHENYALGVRLDGQMYPISITKLEGLVKHESLNVLEPEFLNRYDLKRVHVCFNSGDAYNLFVGFGIFGGDSSFPSSGANISISKPQLAEGTLPIDFATSGTIEESVITTEYINTFADVSENIAYPKFNGDEIYTFQQGEQKLFSAPSGIYSYNESGDNLIETQRVEEGIEWDIRTNTRWNGNHAFTKHITEAVVAYVMSAWLQDKLPERVAFYDNLFTTSLTLATKNLFTKQPPTK